LEDIFVDEIEKGGRFGSETNEEQAQEGMERSGGETQGKWLWKMSEPNRSLAER